MDGQVPFGAAVGAPVLLYIGQFIYSLVSLSETKGDKDTARALAFGIWWMTIVHVSALSGSLLASNNPSTAVSRFLSFARRFGISPGYGICHQRDFCYIIFIFISLLEI